MPLPVGGSDLKWPPDEWHDIYRRYAEHAAWFSGDPGQLSAVYAGGIAVGRFWRTTFDRFWARAVTAPQRRMMLHIPIAADLATVSADMLFSEPPDFVIPDDTANALAVQGRLNEIVEMDAIYRTCAELAETVSALGGGFLRVIWDKDLEPEFPMLTAVDGDAAVPEFKWGRLTAVTFWNRIPDEAEKEVWYHLERHEPGYILTGLYRGNQDRLGERMPLATRPELGLPDEVVETKIEALTATYIPNVRPNRVYRGSQLGRSDYDGIEAMMDALDETWTSWMRDLRLARARLIVPQEYMEAEGKGKGAFFDLDQEIWEALPMPVAKDGSGMITPSQFAIRTVEHQATAQALVERIVAAAGYSGATFGLEATGSRLAGTTATEIVNRERRSYVTRGRKLNYWTEPLSRILEVLLQIDAQHFQPHEVYRPRVEFSDSFRDDPQQVATVVHILRSAEAASAEARVRMVHPKWTDVEVTAETDRILAETVRPTGPPAIGAGSERTGPNGLPMDSQQRTQIDQERLGNFAP